MESLIRNVKKVLKDDVRSSAPFGPILGIGYNATQSRLLSVWTIRTGLEDEINYFGPPRPYLNSVLVLIQNLAIICTVFFAVIIFWNYLAIAYEQSTGHNYIFDWEQTWMPKLSRKPRRNSFSKPDVHPFDDDPDAVEGSILLGTIEMPTRQNRSRYKMTTAKKRIVRKESNNSNR
jgi:hypothetical protein